MKNSTEHCIWFGSFQLLDEDFREDCGPSIEVEVSSGRNISKFYNEMGCPACSFNNWYLWKRNILQWIRGKDFYRCFIWNAISFSHLKFLNHKLFQITLLWKNMSIVLVLQNIAMVLTSQSGFFFEMNWKKTILRWHKRKKHYYRHGFIRL